MSGGPDRNTCNTRYVAIGPHPIHSTSPREEERRSSLHRATGSLMTKIITLPLAARETISTFRASRWGWALAKVMRSPILSGSCGEDLTGSAQF